jgi:hypothetical protein
MWIAPGSCCNQTMPFGKKKTKGIHHDALDTISHRVAFKNWSDKNVIVIFKGFFL